MKIRNKLFCIKLQCWFCKGITLNGLLGLKVRTSGRQTDATGCLRRQTRNTVREVHFSHE